MSSKIISSAESIHLLYSKPNKFPKNSLQETISFTSQMPKSGISTRKSFRPCRAQATARIEAFYAPAETTTETLYELLGIEETESSFSDIKKAYKKMARKYHPDVSPPDRVDEYTRRFIMLHEAYETLSDPKSRASYDRELALGSGFAFSGRKPQHYYQKMEETKEWKTRWQSQLNKLKRQRGKRDASGGMSWGARMRSEI